MARLIEERWHSNGSNGGITCPAKIAPEANERLKLKLKLKPKLKLKLKPKLKSTED